MVADLHDLVPLILTGFLLAQVSITVSQNDFQTCNQQVQWCGQQLRYPFWGGERSVACGYRGLELSCLEGAPSITIASTLYRVLTIDYQNGILTVARSDFWNNTCPANVSPTNVDFTLFEFSEPQARNITLFYSCNPLMAVTLPNRFNCSNTDSLNFYSTNSVAVELTVGCNRNVTVLVNQTAFVALSSMQSSSENLLRDALVNGFSLRWTAENGNCTTCTQSGGVCGYNQTSSAFACYRQAATGSGNNQRANRMPVGLFVAGGILTGVGLGWCIFYCLYRRKRRILSNSIAKQSFRSQATNPRTSGSSAKFSKTTSSNSSSDFGTGSTYFGLQVFSYSELEQATDGFDRARELGNGGFGIVYYGILSDTRRVAIKRLYENNYRRLEQFLNELEILSRLKHENLVKLYGCTSRRSRELLLVYEFIPNGTVSDHLLGKRANSSSLTWPIRLNIAIETADALAYLHRSDIIHRDVKTNNILLDDEFHVKVADFGLSRLFPTDVTHVSTAPQGTPGYVDPEYYQIYHLTEKSDVYSFGVILIELVSSLPAVDTNRNRSDINLANMAVTKIQSQSLQELVDPNLGFETNPQVRRMVTLVAGLAFRCLQPDSNLRPSMGEVLEELKCIKSGNSDQNPQHQVEIIDGFSDDDDDEDPLKGSDGIPSA